MPAHTVATVGPMSDSPLMLKFRAVSVRLLAWPKHCEHATSGDPVAACLCCRGEYARCGPCHAEHVNARQACPICGGALPDDLRHQVEHVYNDGERDLPPDLIVPSKRIISDVVCTACAIENDAPQLS